MGVFVDAIHFGAKSGHFKDVNGDKAKFVQATRHSLEEYKDAQASGGQDKTVRVTHANTPEPQQEPDTMAKREADEQNVKKKRGGTVLDRNRLGVSGVVLGSNKLGV